MATFTTSSAIITSLAAFVVIGGSTAAIAETSEPGDLLYPVKTGVNEKLRSSLSLSAISDADLATELALQRLSEAQELALEGGLTAEARVETENSFSLHHNNAMSWSAEASAKGNSEAAFGVMSDYHARLTAVLQSMKESIDNTEEEARGQLSVMIALVRNANIEVQQQLDILYTDTRNDGEDTRVNIEADARVEGALQDVIINTHDETNAAARSAENEIRGAATSVKSQMDEAKAALEAEVHTTSDTNAEADGTKIDASHTLDVDTDTEADL